MVAAEFEGSDDLLNDFVSWDSIIREFEVIGEATKILLDNNLIDSKYRIVVDFRNKITHHYFGIDAEAVWSIIQNNLPEYKEYIIDNIKTLETKLFQDLLVACRKDNQRHSKVLQSLDILD